MFVPIASHSIIKADQRPPKSMAILNMIPWPMGRKLQWLELTLAALAGAKRYSHKERKKTSGPFLQGFPQIFIHGFCHHPFCWAEDQAPLVLQWLQDSEVPRAPADTF